MGGEEERGRKGERERGREKERKRKREKEGTISFAYLGLTVKSVFSRIASAH